MSNLNAAVASELARQHGLDEQLVLSALGKGVTTTAIVTALTARPATEVSLMLRQVEVGERTPVDFNHGASVLVDLRERALR